jgi:hypothetical protein
MADSFTLGPNAIKQLAHTERTVHGDLSNRIRGIRQPKGRVSSQQIYAQIIDTTDSADGFYDATQVIFDETGFVVADNLLLFNSDATAVGRLKEFYSTGTEAAVDDIYPVYYTSDTTGNYQWFFSAPAGGGQTYAKITANDDGTSGEYDATEQAFSGGAFEDKTDGIAWETGGDDGILKSFNIDSKFALKVDSIHPVYYTADSTSSQWWVDQPIVPDTTQLDVITDIRYEDSSNELQAKTMPILAFVDGTEGDFELVTGWVTTDCS